MGLKNIKQALSFLIHLLPQYFFLTVKMPMEFAYTSTYKIEVPNRILSRIVDSYLPTLRLG